MISDKGSYRYGDVKDASIRDLLAARGVTVVKGNRFPAFWRGSVDLNCTISDDDGTFYDHAQKTSGNIVELGKLILNTNDLDEVYQMIGETLNLPKSRTIERKKYMTVMEKLRAEGFVQTAVYPYHDEFGRLLYKKIRLEKVTVKGREKTFIQQSPDGKFSLTGVRRVPYRLPELLGAPPDKIVYFVEGEKDVETLISRGLIATSSKEWKADYNDFVAGRNVVVIADRDATGEAIAKDTADKLLGVAQSVKIVTVSQLPKGDVTDWLERENGTVEKLAEVVDRAPIFSGEDVKSKAERLNQTPFSVYDGAKLSKSLPELEKEFFDRLCGYPKRVGDNLVYVNDSQEVIAIPNTNALFAYLQNFAKVEWDPEVITKSEFFESICVKAEKFDGISYRPHYPSRANYHYITPQLPPPSAGHEAFWKLVDYHKWSTDFDRILIASLFIAPIFNNARGTTPMFAIDSDDGQGAGKTSVADTAIYLHGFRLKCGAFVGGNGIRCNPSVIAKDDTEIKKRILSLQARNECYVLFDNCTNVLRADSIAEIITAKSITGRPAYGREETARPNDLTYIATMNGAQFDTDVLERTVIIKIRATPKRPEWRGEVNDYIDANRLQIWSDILDILKSENSFQVGDETYSRLSAFENNVFMKLCADREQYLGLRCHIEQSREGGNVDLEKARAIQDKLISLLDDCEPKFHYGLGRIDIERDAVFVTTNALRCVLDSYRVRQIILNYAAKGYFTIKVNPKPDLYPSNGNRRWHGIMFGRYSRGAEVRFITYDEQTHGWREKAFH